MNIRFDVCVYVYQTRADAGGVYETVTVAEHMAMPRSDSKTGEPIKLTSNILKDGTWVGEKPRVRKMTQTI